ncbi:hypothetical protein [Novosphingobium album (ex Hu et al. 2023)]|uniref:HEAT repeat domain-containing protein n=1 Tax=Novosphingobium album (ex Hu et al. 2023) TaxID=2930093 RepID=A0ABT0B109_9SPHN|nr:hypothetical protein [Novosphingobium album (ex Hu et al. 2023)]MCJ2178563.1 hypothetical protein [Novosphingobium album (ex Hu et al. 2023)]
MLARCRQDASEWEHGQAELARRLAGWRASPAVAPVLSAMNRFGGGDTLETCGPLAELFSGESGVAMDFVRSFAAAGLAGLRDHPLGQLPLLHGTRTAAPALVLASAGRASLALAAYDGSVLDTLPPPKTAKFVPRETWVHVLEGSGIADLVLLRDEETQEGRRVLHSGSIDLQPGTVTYRYGRRQALQVRSARGSLVLLRLQRRFPDREPVREYSLPDGALVHQTAARAEDTMLELAVSLLGRMGRRDAVTPLVRLASGVTDPDAGQSLRWQALREALAMDPAAGLDLLAMLATSPGDALARPAAALRASLLEARPELGRSG